MPNVKGNGLYHRYVEVNTKICIAGSRSLVDDYHVKNAIAIGLVYFEAHNTESNPEYTYIIGDAKGVDTIAKEYLTSFINSDNIKIYVPRWDLYGKSAGPRRNKEMIDDADALIAIWDGKSRGTKSTIKFAEEKGIPCYIMIIKAGRE